MHIWLESVRFRIGDRSENGAFKISVPLAAGERQIISVPEWRAGQRRFPAAFAPPFSGGNPFIHVEFGCTELRPVEVAIGAVARPGDIMGEVATTQIQFRDGRWSGRMNLPNARLGQVNRQTIRWAWHVISEYQPIVLDTSESEHEIYTVLAMPTCPWEPSGMHAYSVPWVEALDLAFAWAGGTATTRDYLTAITRRLFLPGRGEPRWTYSGIYTYAESNRFLLATFLADVRRGDICECDDPDRCLHAACPQLNCDDCASIVSTFTNLIGGTSYQVKLERADNGDLYTRLVRLIGQKTDKTTGFQYHVTAWDSKVVSEATRVWDCCLGISTAKSIAPFADLMFGGAECDINAYRYRAFQSATALELKVTETKIRSIAATAKLMILTPPTDSGHFEFKEWNGTYRGIRGLGFWNVFGGRGIRNWKPLQSYRYDQQPKPWLVQTIWRIDDKGQTLKTSVYECESRSDAQLAMLQFLDNQPQSPIQRRSEKLIGDVCFYDPKNQPDLILVVRGNLFLKVQKARGDHTSLEDLAVLIDDWLMAGLRVDEGSGHDGRPIYSIFQSQIAPPRHDEELRLACQTAGIQIDETTVRLEGPIGQVHTIIADHYRQQDTSYTAVINVDLGETQSTI